MVPIKTKLVVYRKTPATFFNLDGMFSCEKNRLEKI